MKEIAKLPCGHCINYSKVAPNGKYLASVGDSCRGVIMHTIKDGVYTRAPDIPIEMNSYSSYMSVGWDTLSNFLAVGSEGGHFVLFDVSNIEQPKQILLYKCLTCCRGVKFAPITTVKLVAFLESSKLIHIVNFLTLDHLVINLTGSELKQPLEGVTLVLNVPMQNTQTSISGMAWSPDGSKLFVAANCGIFEIPVFFGLLSLMDTCIYFVKKNRARAEEYNWCLEILPLDIRERLES
eukprot:TRINITY_DN20808_c0_g1_i1.p1 TRINITY_DN20808_c0_g1~~TRINITY_DN20808_c0_g1_i1.p1  ORF type:complete len:238 (+),score=15.99 TRINITY_DN20808_c0_g1_i1:218-931(+)